MSVLIPTAKVCKDNDTTKYFFKEISYEVFTSFPSLHTSYNTTQENMELNPRTLHRTLY